MPYRFLGTGLTHLLLAVPGLRTPAAAASQRCVHIRHHHPPPLVILLDIMSTLILTHALAPLHTIHLIVHHASFHTCI